MYLVLKKYLLVAIEYVGKVMVVKQIWFKACGMAFM